MPLQKYGCRKEVQLLAFPLKRVRCDSLVWYVSEVVSTKVIVSSLGTFFSALYVYDESSVGDESSTGGSRWAYVRAYVAKEATPHTCFTASYSHTGACTHLPIYRWSRACVLERRGRVSVVTLANITAPCPLVFGQYCQVCIAMEEHTQEWLWRWVRNVTEER